MNRPNPNPSLNAMSQVDAGELGAEAAKVAKAISSSKPSADFAEFFTSHEGMQLDLEEALTRKVGSAYQPYP